MIEDKITPREIVTDLPLYEPVPLKDLEEDKLRHLFFNEKIYDIYCVKCGKEVPFKCEGKETTSGFITSRGLNYATAMRNFGNMIENFWSNVKQTMELRFTCQRVPVHTTSFQFIIDNNNLIKIGQFPSMASIELPGIEKYKKVLGSQYIEFSKGLGLVSHGIGIGSFVYLRRVFERLVEEAHRTALEIEIPDWNDERFVQSRMNEKVQLLGEVGLLPEIVLEYKALYGIVSKGIHELSEQECLEIFPHLKVAIELILDEKLHEMERKKKIAETRKYLEKTSSALK